MQDEDTQAGAVEPANTAAPSSSDVWNNWAKIRRLAQELSVALAETDEGRWYAQVLPAGRPYAIGFGVVELFARPGVTEQRAAAYAAFLERAAPSTRVIHHATELACACEDLRGGAWGAFFDWEKGRVIVTGKAVRS